LRGYINKKKSRIWSVETPHALHKNPWLAPEDGFSCAVSRKRIVGTIVFEVKIAEKFNSIFSGRQPRQSVKWLFA
jgi:hypothetical protein